MSRLTIEEELQTAEQPMEEVIEQAQYVPSVSFVDILKTPTGEGTIEDYLIHPLNFNESKGMARVLRGLTGFLGNINLAIADVIIGALDVLQSNKKGKESNVHNGEIPSVS